MDTWLGGHHAKCGKSDRDVLCDLTYVWRLETPSPQKQTIVLVTRAERWGKRVVLVKGCRFKMIKFWGWDGQPGDYS